MTQGEYDKQESEKRKAIKKQWGIKFIVGDKCLAPHPPFDKDGIVVNTRINPFMQEIVAVRFEDGTEKEYTAEQLKLIEI